MIIVHEPRGFILAWPRGGRPGPAACAVCGKLSAWVEVNYQCHLHPGPCERQMDAEFYEALRTSDLAEQYRRRGGDPFAAPALRPSDPWGD